MNEVRLLDMLLSIGWAAIGWWAKTTWEHLAKAKEEMAQLKEMLPKEYVRKADWDRATDKVTDSISDLKDEIGKRLDEIWREMKDKVDKK